MYGTAVALKSFLAVEDEHYLHLAQCGLCAGLRRRYGLPYAMLANCDARLLVLVAASQSPCELTTSATMCPAKAFCRRVPSMDNAPAVEFGSACAVLIWWERLLDRRRDCRNPLWRLGPLTAEPAVHIARTVLAGLCFPMAEIERARALQMDLEHTKGLPLGAYLQPTGDVLGRLFAHSAELAAKPDNARMLSLLGQAFGRVVALLDACEDLSSDRLRGLYNPLSWHLNLKDKEPLPPDLLAEALSVIVQEFKRLEHALTRTEFHQLEGVVTSILSRGVPAKVQRGLRKLWRGNHWEADWPDRLLVGLDDEVCSVCRVPHLPAKASRAVARTAGDRPRGGALWSVCRSLSRPQASIAMELGYSSRHEQLLSALLPVVASSGLQ
ncbi:MAG TPA: DUF5685 family protein [Anaerolineae bacterium]|nr:DUF5685 family protein [Anaerolineae bacterium]